MFGLVDSLSLANGRGLMTGFFWMGTSVYSPTLEGIRNGFWEELALIQHRWGSPWCLFGDFNTVCFPRERLGSNQFNPAMIAFSDFINSANLIDLPLEGGLFTWCNGSDPPSMSCMIMFWYRRIGKNIFLTRLINYYQNQSLIIAQFLWKLGFC